MRIKTLVCGMILGGLLNGIQSPPAQAANPSDVIYKGRYAEGIQTLSDSTAPDSRFAIAVMQFCLGLEELSQDLHRYGLLSELAMQMGIPFLRLPIPPNPHPETITSADFARILTRFETRIKQVDTTLSQLDETEFQLPLELGKIKIDLDGDGKYTASETLTQIYRHYNQAQAEELKADPKLLVNFDRADAEWLRGYSKLLQAICNLFLGYDGTAFFPAVAPLVFLDPKPLPPLGRVEPGLQAPEDWMELIAILHQFNLPVANQARLSQARRDFLDVIILSRKTWQLITRENDKQREWLPGAKQTSATGARITAEQIKAWHDFLNEAEALLEGRKLAPHWRVLDGRGVNLKRCFENSPPFDPVMLVHGQALSDCLETGDMTEEATWERLQRMFGGEFLGFALWIN